MNPYVVSLAVGVLVGVIYALARVRSPAPPVIALLGLLGMLAGEQGVGFARAHLWPEAVAAPSQPSLDSAGKKHAS